MFGAYNCLQTEPIPIADVQSIFSAICYLIVLFNHILFAMFQLIVDGQPMTNKETNDVVDESEEVERCNSSRKRKADDEIILPSVHKVIVIQSHKASIAKFVSVFF